VLGDLVVGAAASLIASFIVCRAVIGSTPVDLPDAARKSHGGPTPTSGGVGVALGVAVGLIALSLFSSGWRYEISPLGADLLTTAVAFAFAFLLLGFVDDARPLSPGLKFLVFGALAVGAALSVEVVERLPLGGDFYIELGPWLGLAGTALWVFTLVNCVNFMDGANGVSLGSVAIGLAAIGLIAATVGEGSQGAAGIAFCAVGAIVGFLAWNLNGRLFAGDSGALFVGALAAIAALIAIRRVGMSPWIAPIAFFPLLADALLTLAWRARRGRSLLEGHSEHLYQIALRARWSHGQVALVYWAATLVCAGIAYALALQPEGPLPWIALLALSLAATFIARAVRGAAKKRGIAEI
jgi:UDP-N-acetylmuramyl pentapeptide phosphotransferase/UDP-N-acetylglucosamine-1-phosphate transferase